MAEASLIATVTLTLDGKEAATLYRLLGNHITGVGDERDALDTVYDALNSVTIDECAPLFLERGSDCLTLTSK